VVSVITVATPHTRTANFWTRLEQRIIARAINEWQNDCGPVSSPKDSMSNICNFSTPHRNTVLLKKITFLFIKQHKLWNNEYFRIAMVAGIHCCRNNSSNIGILKY